MEAVARSEGGDRLCHLFLWLLLVLLPSLPTCRSLEFPRAEDADARRTAFAAADRDGDGRVTLEELARYQHREGLAEMDLDGDGKISGKEWENTHPSEVGKEDLFTKLDKNGDGLLDEDEGIGFFIDDNAYQAAFTRQDENADAGLSWDEFSTGDLSDLGLNFFDPQAKSEETSPPTETISAQP